MESTRTKRSKKIAVPHRVVSPLIHLYHIDDHRGTQEIAHGFPQIVTFTRAMLSCGLVIGSGASNKAPSTLLEGTSE
eukprot:3548428-Pyramimonas_sp.AAC.2